MRRPLKLVLLGLGVVVLALVGSFAFLALRNSDAPPEVALSDAPATTVAPDIPAEGAGEPDEGSPATADGRWVVRAGDGTEAGTVVGYRVTEEFASIPNPVEAVGRTPAVTGDLTVSGAVVDAVTITADLTQLSSDETRRDNYIRGRGLEIDAFPEATFTLTEPIDLGEAPEDGEDVDATAIGDFTLHGVTQPVAIPLEARWTGDTLEVIGSLDVVFADFEIETPSIGGFVSVEDEGTMELRLLLDRS